jgi:hypothetical protein
MHRGAVRPQSCGTAWVRRAITLAVLAAGVWSVTASRAEAGPAPIVRQFMCPLPFVGTQAVTISVVPPALDTVNVGVPSPRLRLTATGTVTSAARLVVSFLGSRSPTGAGQGRQNRDPLAATRKTAGGSSSLPALPRGGAGDGVVGGS